MIRAHRSHRFTSALAGAALLAVTACSGESSRKVDPATAQLDEIVKEKLLVEAHSHSEARCAAETLRVTAPTTYRLLLIDDYDGATENPDHDLAAGRAIAECWSDTFKYDLVASSLGGDAGVECLRDEYFAFGLPFETLMVDVEILEIAKDLDHRARPAWEAALEERKDTFDKVRDRCQLTDSE